MEQLKDEKETRLKLIDTLRTVTAGKVRSLRPMHALDPLWAAKGPVPHRFTWKWRGHA